MVTRTRRLLGLPLIAALIATVLVAPQAHAATVTTWAQLRDAFAAGGSITVGADISGGGITASQSTPVTLDLNGYDVTLTGGPALQIEGNANVTLRDTDGTGSLTAIGTELTAAAIGTLGVKASPGVTPGTLIIDGADVTAQMGISTAFLTPQVGATVGGGDGVDGLTLTVQSGSLTASSEDRTNAAAIGGGNRAGSGSITINGGTVMATAGVHDELYNATYGAAIGGGRGGTADITVNDGAVTAITAGHGAAVGGGADADGGTIRIKGGQLNTTTMSNGAAIGGGQAGNGGTITLTGGTVTATSEGRGAAIGGGRAANGGDIAIMGGVITAHSQSFSSAIGGGVMGDGGNITILGGDVTATSAVFGASIGGGSDGAGGDVAISGGTVTVRSANYGAGIGGGHNGPGGTVTISGGILDISAESQASAIGAGSDGPKAPPRPVSELGTLQIRGTAPAGHPDAVTGRQASPLKVTAPTSPIGVAIENSTVDGEADLLRTTISFGHYVSFDTKGGAPAPADQVVVVGGKATAPVAPTRTGHDFTGWFNGSQKHNFNSPITQATTLVAGWDAHTYQVTFDSAGGSAVGAQSVKYGSTASAPKAPTRKGYIFSGWYAGNTKYNFGSAVTGDMTLTARWEATPAGAGPQPGVSVNLVDVSSNSSSKHYTQFHREISWLASTGITKSWNVGGGRYEFRAKESITREAMAAFMYRYAGSPKVVLPGRSPFKDVTPSNTNFYKEIIWMNQQGISTGWNASGGKEFRPKDNITRDAMAAFMYRFAGKPATTPPAKSPFTDVSTSSQFYREVTWLANTGISKGWNVGSGKYEYRPYDQISREAMAAFLYRFDRL